MKRLGLLLFLIGCISCDDGDLQIEEVNFDSARIETCDNVDDEELDQTTFFFKLDDDQALLLTLEEGLINNQTSAPNTLNSSLPTASSLRYRFFSGSVTSDYFCNAIPPLQPTVVKENVATAGDVLVVTRVDTIIGTTKSYSHTISIDNLSLVNDLGEQLTDLSTLRYGEFTTTTAISAARPIDDTQPNAFADYEDLNLQRCVAPPIAETLRFYKVNNDEIITLDVATDENLFENEATGNTPRTLSLEDNDALIYTVFNTVADENLACGTEAPTSVNSWRFVSSAGSLNVSTGEGQVDGQGRTTFTHTLSLSGLILTTNFDDDSIKTTDLDLIESITLGTYTTIVE